MAHRARNTLRTGADPIAELEELEYESRRAEAKRLFLAHQFHRSSAIAVVSPSGRRASASPLRTATRTQPQPPIDVVITRRPSTAGQLPSPVPEADEPVHVRKFSLGSDGDQSPGSEEDELHVSSHSGSSSGRSPWKLELSGKALSKGKGTRQTPKSRVARRRRPSTAHVVRRTTPQQPSLATTARRLGLPSSSNGKRPTSGASSRHTHHHAESGMPVTTSTDERNSMHRFGGPNTDNAHSTSVHTTPATAAKLKRTPKPRNRRRAASAHATRRVSRAPPPPGRPLGTQQMQIDTTTTSDPANGNNGKAPRKKMKKRRARRRGKGKAKSKERTMVRSRSQSHTFSSAAR